MATWHQEKAMREGRVKLYHETMWSLVSDPPNDFLTVTLFRTEAEARETMKRWEAAGQENLYVLKPASY